MVEETKAQNKNVQHYVELGKKMVMETKITGDVSQDNFIKGFPPCSPDTITDIPGQVLSL